MSVIPSFGACRSGGFPAALVENRLGFGAVAGLNRTVKVSRPFEDGKFHISPFSLSHSRRTPKCPNVHMTLVDEKLERGKDLVKPSDILAYDLVQGAHVRWSYIMDKSVPNPPTAVLLHGILGSRKNWVSLGRPAVPW